VNSGQGQVLSVELNWVAELSVRLIFRFIFRLSSIFHLSSTKAASDNRLITLGLKISDDDRKRFTDDATAINCQPKITTKSQACLL
jgi:hypothetical protein